MTGTDITDKAIAYVVEQGFTRETDTRFNSNILYEHPSGRVRVEIQDADPEAASFTIHALSAAPAQIPLWTVQTTFAPHAVFTASVDAAITAARAFGSPTLPAAAAGGADHH